MNHRLTSYHFYLFSSHSVVSNVTHQKEKKACLLQSCVQLQSAGNGKGVYLF